MDGQPFKFTYRFDLPLVMRMIGILSRLGFMSIDAPPLALADVESLPVSWVYELIDIKSRFCHLVYARCDA